MLWRFHRTPIKRLPAFPATCRCTVGLLACVALFTTQTACSDPESIQPSTIRMKVSSANFSDGGEIPKQFTCDGEETSPYLMWTSVPPETKSFALIAYDRDSLFRSFIHWVLYDVKPETRQIVEDLPRQSQLPSGSRQGQNGFRKIGYSGPCPPGHSTHRYVFTLYALDIKPDLPPGASKKQLLKAIKNHILAEGQLMGRYHR